MINKILVPVDGSEHAFKAVDLASDLAQKYEAGLLLLHVVTNRELPEGARRFAEVEHIEEPPEWIYQKIVAQNILDQSEKRAKQNGAPPTRTTIHEGDPAAVIINVAKVEDADVIVMGTRGLSDLKGLIVGSVAHKVSHLADCTVVSVK